MTAAIPANETERLNALRQCRVLDTPPEDIYDDITRLASQVCNAPIATVTLIDQNRQWFKSAVGVSKREDPREIAFCAHTILGTELMLVPDTQKDKRFADNPLVTGNPHIRFYAGVPILTPEGFALGTLCVIDIVPRRLTEQQESVLAILARQVAGRLELQRRVNIQEALVADLRESQERLALKAALIDISQDAIFVQAPMTNRITFWSSGAEATYGWTRDEAYGQSAGKMLKTEFPIPYTELMAQLERTGHWEGDLRHSRKDGTCITVASRWAMHGSNPNNEILEVNRDVTEQRRLEADREAYSALQGHIAETLQRALLITPSPDCFPGLTVSAFYSGAEEDVLIGGDFFDLYPVTETKIALVVGDATGKGLEAATSTAEIKFALRALLGEYQTPALALTRLNHFLAEKERLATRTRHQSYTALSVVIVDTASGEMVAASAGMESPLLLRTEGDAVTFEECGPLLGISHDTEYQDQRDTLREGDCLVMTTDGILEARSPASRLDFFGIDGLTAAMREETERHSLLDDTAQSVVNQARAFAGGAIHDDVCLLIARRGPTTSVEAPVG